MNNRYGVEVVSVNPAARNTYVFRVTAASELSVLDLARLYYEKLPAVWSTPDFIRSFKRTGTPNDPYFSNQYYLNTIDAPEAWDITTGSSSIVIAVIDDGGEPHEDLPLSRTVTGYDYVDDEQPIVDGNESHGMAVAGVIAATQNNNKGISGLAPNCKVMFLRVFGKLGEPVADSKFAAAIDFAWKVAQTSSTIAGLLLRQIPMRFPWFLMQSKEP